MSQSPVPVQPTQAATRGHRRWRWYHFYFILALFDVLVILASLFINHTTLSSFDGALGEVLHIHNQQNRLSELATILSDLNAPGNDIFQSRDLALERRRFAEASARLSRTLSISHEYFTDRPQFEREFRIHLNQMIMAEERIFEIFAKILGQDQTAEAQQGLLQQATSTMAEMDRAQAEALLIIRTVSASLLDTQKNVLDRHQEALRDRSRVEVLFALIVAFILTGVFWYGRQLQQAHERFEVERLRVGEERRNRLAAVGEVCFSCAHGIRNPLASISSSAQLIVEYGQLDEKSRRRLEDIIVGCRHLNDRVTKLLAFARAPALELEEVRPDELLDQAARALEPTLEARGIALRRRYDPVLPSIQADRTVLTSAIGELLDNALDHMPNGGPVTLLAVHAPEGERAIELGVVDSGPGIDDAIKHQVCELFFTQKPNGHGIGLASVKRAADLHGGRVIIADAKPNGADIRMRLPVGG